MVRWGLFGAIKQAHTFETIEAPLQELRRKFPNAGAAAIRDHLRNIYGIRVAR
jgi:hypothetical protein